MLLGSLLHSGIVACLRIVIVKERSDLVRSTAPPTKRLFIVLGLAWT